MKFFEAESEELYPSNKCYLCAICLIPVREEDVAGLLKKAKINEDVASYIETEIRFQRVYATKNEAMNEKNGEKKNLLFLEINADVDKTKNLCGEIKKDGKKVGELINLIGNVSYKNRANSNPNAPNFTLNREEAPRSERKAKL